MSLRPPKMIQLRAGFSIWWVPVVCHWSHGFWAWVQVPGWLFRHRSLVWAVMLLEEVPVVSWVCWHERICGFCRLLVTQVCMSLGLFFHLSYMVQNTLVKTSLFTFLRWLQQILSLGSAIPSRWLQKFYPRGVDCSVWCEFLGLLKSNLGHL